MNSEVRAANITISLPTVTPSASSVWRNGPTANRRDRIIPATSGESPALRRSRLWAFEKIRQGRHRFGGPLLHEPVACVFEHDNGDVPRDQPRLLAERYAKRLVSADRQDGDVELRGRQGGEVCRRLRE